MLHFINNGMFDTSGMFLEDERTNYSLKNVQVIDYDISKFNNELAIIHSSGHVYIYEFESSSIFL